MGRNNFHSSISYENSLDIDIKKTKGVYYTPKVVVDYIMEKTLKGHDIIENPYLKVLDISCGCGNFLLEAYDILYELFEKNIEDLAKRYGEEYWKAENLHNHILSNCIYGADIDREAVDILKTSLLEKKQNSKVDKLNIYCCDSLNTSWYSRFDYIVGNPPYIGHKNLDKEYKQFLLKNYGQVYKDKSDLYFCFYEKIIGILKEGGVSSIITPRYFLESPSAKYLREYIKSNVIIDELVDFLGANVFKNIGVASCIITFNKKLKQEQQKDPIDVFRIKNEDISINTLDNLSNFIQKDLFEHFSIDVDALGDEWVIVNRDKYDFYNKIQSTCEYVLDDIAVSFQGIITGCDKAFIIEKDDDRIKKVSESLLKNWIKSKGINPYIVSEARHKLIYSNDIKSEEEYPVVINEFIGRYREKLENRRECKKNLRKWYELQWGREKSLFERKKIMYPYKSNNNRFAIDYQNNFSSADVYSFFIKDEYIDEFSYEYLVGILNSEVYNKYYKITAKKMSKNIYDYYPNKVMKIKIFKDHNYYKIEKLSKQIISDSYEINEILKEKDLKSDIINQKKENISKLQREIDYLIESSLGVKSPI